MVALLLFAILVVLLIATGLMPGVLKGICTFLALVVLITIFQMIGPAYGLGAIGLVVGALVVLWGIAMYMQSPTAARRANIKRYGFDPMDDKYR